MPLRPPQHAGPALLARERQSSSATGSPESGGARDGRDAPDTSGPQGSSDDNPFAPPPEGRPDQPWRPRHQQGQGPDGGDSGSGRDRNGWGQWTNPGPGGSSGGQGPQGPVQNGPGGPRGMRWDPKDVYQRRARYALLSGLWGFFFALITVPEAALLLGALALYWGVSALRAKDRDDTAPRDGQPAGRPDPFAPAPHQETIAATGDRAHARSSNERPGRPASPVHQARPGSGAALAGLVAAVLALLFVAATYSAQFVYHDYYACVDDALTHQGQVACNTELPPSLRSVLGTQN